MSDVQEPSELTDRALRDVSSIQSATVPSPIAGRSNPAADRATPHGVASHIVRFYENDDVLSETVAAFLSDGLDAGDLVVVIATESHRTAFKRRLQTKRRAEADVAQIVFLDAEETLATFMCGDNPDADLFDASIGALFARHAPSGTRIRAYGEMVDVLWSNGQRRAAIRLEELWNALQARQPFTLLCAYAMANFYKEPAGIGRVCAVHSHITGSDAATPWPAEKASAVPSGYAHELIHEIAQRKEVEHALRESLHELRGREETLKQSDAARTAAAEHTERLLQITGAIADAVTEDQVFEATVDHVARAVRAQTAALWLLEDEGSVRLARAVGYQEAARRRFDGVRLDASPGFPALDSIARRAPIWIASPEELLRLYPHLGSAVTPGLSYRVACLPLMAHGRTLGALGLTIEGAGDSTEGEREFLLLAAGYASQAIERLRVLEAERRSRARAEQLSLENADARRRAEHLYQFAQAVTSATKIDQVFDAALDTICSALHCHRAAILIADDEGVMRFRAWRHLSDAYRSAVDGHSPWARDAADPEAVLIPFAQSDETMRAYWPLFRSENIGALAFIPLVSSRRLLGKFMVYYNDPHEFRSHELETAQAISRHLASVTSRFAAIAKLEETIHYNELFAGALAHDLRNPLHAIMTAAHVALTAEGDDQIADAGQIRPLTRILASGERMSRMIQQLLDLTLARSAGRIDVSPRETNLADLCSEAVGELELAHPTWRIERTDTGELHGRWDPDRISQIVSNVVANAGQHGTPGGRILIALDGMAADVVRFEVSNDGVVPAEILPSVFDPFRGSRQARHRSRGLGLGLFIVRELVRSHGGSVDLRSSEALGTTTVTITLPRRRRDGTRQ